MHEMSEEIQEKKALTVYDLLAFMLEQVSAVAWQKLGLQPDMVTQKIEPDLDQARVAIDVASYLVSQLEAQLDEADRKHLQSLVRDLKVNYVQKQGGA
jgi:hypothetical protein